MGDVYTLHRHRKLFNIGRGGQTQRDQVQYLGGGGGGFIAKVHIRMRAHANVCKHMC